MGKNLYKSSPQSCIFGFQGGSWKVVPDEQAWRPKLNPQNPQKEDSMEEDSDLHAHTTAQTQNKNK